MSRKSKIPNFESDEIFEGMKEKFQQCTSNLERVNFFLRADARGLVNFHDFVNRCENRKNDEEAMTFRNMGNIHMKKENYMGALEQFTSSVCWAKTKKCASFMYSTRSQLLERMGRYDESLIDLDRALAGCPDELKKKLLLRRKDLVKKEKTTRKDPKQPTYSEEIINGLEVHHNSKYGRHMIACKDIEIGELLVVEKAQCFELSVDYFMFCHECLRRCYCLIPCDDCVNTMYCSQECKEKAYDKYHKYECSVLKGLCASESSQLITPLRVALLVIKGVIRADEVRKMQSHMDKDPLPRLYTWAMVTSIIFVLLKSKTSFFSDHVGCEETFKDLMLFTVYATKANLLGLKRLEVDKYEGFKEIPYALAFYLKTNAFNHSCYPNAFQYNDGSKVIVRAIATIKKGEQVFISYRFTYCTHPKSERIETLQKECHFTCTCIACTNSWPIEEITGELDRHFLIVDNAIVRNDQKLLKSLSQNFIRKLKGLEKQAPTQGLMVMRQLVIDCFQVYDYP